MAEKPGVLLYYSLWGSMKLLSDSELGALTRAIMEYDGINQLELPANAALLWPMVECQLVVDDGRYRERVERTAYASYVRKQKDRGEEILSREEWSAQKALEQ